MDKIFIYEKPIRFDICEIVDENVINRFTLSKIIINLLIYDDFVKEVDFLTGSKIFGKQTKEERIKELELIIHNTARGLVVINLALKYLSYMADEGVNRVLDEYWRSKLSGFKGFGDKNGKV